MRKKELCNLVSEIVKNVVAITRIALINKGEYKIRPYENFE
jgi:hypothetical protein